MATALLRIGALALLPWLAACGDEPELVVEAPLLVFNTYPANGATVARSDLAEIALTFSEDLGEADFARSEALSFLVLADDRGPIDFVRDDQTNVAYDDATWTLRVELDPAVRAGLVAGTHSLTVLRELKAQDGPSLPTDLVVRFHIATE